MAVDAGSVTNTASAQAQDGQGTNIASKTVSQTVEAQLMPAISMAKSSVTASYSVPGQTIAYDYLVTNTGNQTLATLQITDDKIVAANDSDEAASAIDAP